MATWTIYRMPNDSAVTREFASLDDAREFAARVHDNPRWAGAIMSSPYGDQITIGEDDVAR